MGSHKFGFFGVRQFFIFTVTKRTRMFVWKMKKIVTCSSFNLKMGQFIKIESDSDYIFAQK